MPSKLMSVLGSKTVPQMAAMYRSGMSLADIARQSGLSISTARARLIAIGMEMRHHATDSTRLKMSLAGKGRVRAPFSDEWKRKISEAMKLRPSQGWRIKRGYVVFTTGPHKDRHEHDVIVEERIGRRLRYKHEHVHHIDENRANNADSNLELMTISDHASHHATENHHKRNRNSIGQFK